MKHAVMISIRTFSSTSGDMRILRRPDVVPPWTILLLLVLFALCSSSQNAFAFSLQCQRPPPFHSFAGRRTNSQIGSTAYYNSYNEDLLPGIAAIDAANAELLTKLEALRDQPYFRFYSIDILASCEYMPQELYECYTQTCEIYPEDGDQVPVAIREQDMDEHYFELDGWARWDMPTDDYYDAYVNAEGYTGYDGAEVWTFIHDRICFPNYGYNDDHWKADFNRAVSGLHSMVSAQVVRGIRERVQSGRGFSDEEIWTDPKKEFERRLGPNGETPLAMENLYFCFMLLLRAVAEAKTRLVQDCSVGKVICPIKDLNSLLSLPILKDESVRVASRKLHDHAVRRDRLDDDQDGGGGGLWEARMRCRDLVRITNCVQCNKCRLHGKIGVLGLATALQLLVGQRGEGGDPDKVHRVELAALLTTLHKFSKAIQFCQEMKKATS